MFEITFYILSILAIFGALMVIFTKNAMYSVLFLILTFFAIAGHFLLLQASFLGIVNIIVYAGAIMVLFLYVIMLLNLKESNEIKKPLIARAGAIVSAGLLMLVLVAAVRTTEDATQAATTYSPNLGTVKTLGKVLFTEFLLPFEVASILFLAAMVGAVMLGKREIE